MTDDVAGLVKRLRDSVCSDFTGKACDEALSSRCECVYITNTADLIERLSAQLAERDAELSAAKAALAESRNAALDEAAKAIPMTWLDPMLTGDRAVIKEPPYSPIDIEVVLRNVKDAILALKGGK